MTTLSVFYTTPPIIISVLLFLAMFACNRFGFLTRKAHILKNQENRLSEFGPMEGSLLGLLALLMSFTFNAANNKYEARRSAVVQEANNIRVSIYRAELLPDSLKPATNKYFRGYINSRINYSEAGLDETGVSAAFASSELYLDSLRHLITPLAIQYPGMPSLSAFKESIATMKSDMITREELRHTPIPESILWMLSALACTSGFVVGYATKSKQNNVTMVVLFGIMFCLTTYLILDLDQPRKGLITLHDAQKQIDRLLYYLE